MVSASDSTRSDANDEGVWKARVAQRDFLKIWVGGIEYGTKAGWTIHAREHDFEEAASSRRSENCTPKNPPFHDHFVMRIQTKFGSRVVSGAPYMLEIGDEVFKGKLATNGMIDHKVKPGVSKARVSVFSYGENQPPLRWEADVKQQADMDSLEGLQSRLKNLGFE